MAMNSSNKQDIFQYCWIVNDMASAVRHWHRSAGVGPFYVLENLWMRDHTYRGRRPGDVHFSMALAQAGSVQIELITQHNDVSSSYLDTFGIGGVGFHHVGLIPRDYDAELAAYLEQGDVISQSGTFDGTRYVYIDTRPKLGFMVELVDPAAGMLELFETVRAGARNWDGKEPYRVLGTA